MNTSLFFLKRSYKWLAVSAIVGTTLMTLAPAFSVFESDAKSRSLEAVQSQLVTENNLSQTTLAQPVVTPLEPTQEVTTPIVPQGDAGPIVVQPPAGVFDPYNLRTYPDYNVQNPQVLLQWEADYPFSATTEKSQEILDEYVFEIERSENGDPFETLEWDNLDTQYIDDEVYHGVVYDYRVRARHNGTPTNYTNTVNTVSVPFLPGQEESYFVWQDQDPTSPNYLTYNLYWNGENGIISPSPAPNWPYTLSEKEEREIFQTQPDPVLSRAAEDAGLTWDDLEGFEGMTEDLSRLSRNLQKFFRDSSMHDGGTDLGGAVDVQPPLNCAADPIQVPGWFDTNGCVHGFLTLNQKVKLDQHSDGIHDKAAMIPTPAPQQGYLTWDGIVSPSFDGLNFDSQYCPNYALQSADHPGGTGLPQKIVIFLANWTRISPTATNFNGSLFANCNPDPNDDPVAIIDTPPSDVTIQVGSTVDFTGTGVPAPGTTIVSYLWNFGLGSGIPNSTQEDPGARAFNIPGIFTVSFTVTDNNGSTDTDTVDVTVVTNNLPPTAVIVTTPTPPNGFAPFSVQFDGSNSSDPNGDPLTYGWDFGDGATATGQVVTHVYQNSGNYTASLTVTDNGTPPLQDTATVQVNVEQNRAPIIDADITTSNNIRNNVPSGTVQLAGSAFDPDGDPLTILWTQVNGPAVTLSDPTILDPTFTGVAGNMYAFQLSVSDGQGNTVTDLSVIIMEGANQAPVANAGPDQTNVAGGTVQLDGSGSFDPDNNPITYSWTQSGGSASATLSDPTIVNPTFTGIPGEFYVFDLTVTDVPGGLTDTDTVVISMVSANQAPVANAGPDQNNVLCTGLVQLDGSGSYDPDGDPITYLWQQTNGSSGVTLSDPTIVNPSFTGICGEFYVFDLTVTDPSGLSDTDSVVISMQQANRPPIANAGPDQFNVGVGSVQLDGCSSFDPDGDPLTFFWTQTAGSSGVTLNDPTICNPTFTGNLGEFYVFELLVADPFGLTDTDSVVITMVSTTTLLIQAPLNPNMMNPRLPLGVNEQLATFAQLSNGNLIYVNPILMSSWSSDNTAIANVSNQGLITPVSVGSTTIRATYIDGSGRVAYGSIPVTVNSATATSILVEPKLNYPTSFDPDGPGGTPPTPPYLMPYDSTLPNMKHRFLAYVTFDNGDVYNLYNQVTWSVSVPTVIEALPAGQISTKSTGSSLLTATFGLVSGSAMINVTAGSLSTLDIQNISSLAGITDFTGPLGLSQRLIARADFSNGTFYNVYDKITWTSSDTSIFTLGNGAANKGFLNPVASGTTNVNVSYYTMSDSQVFTIKAASVTQNSFSILPSSFSVGVGSTRQLEARAGFSDASTYRVLTYNNGSQSAGWTSLNNSVTQVGNSFDTYGVAKGMGSGATTVRASYKNFSATSAVTVP